MVKRSSKWVVSSLAEVAAFFGVSLTTVKSDWRAAEMPGRPRKWDLSAIAKWLRKRRAGASGNGDGYDQDTKRLRAELLRLQLAKEEGRMIDVKVACERHTRLVCWVRGVLATQGAELAPRVSGKGVREVRAIIDQYGRDKLEEEYKRCLKMVSAGAGSEGKSARNQHRASEGGTADRNRTPFADRRRK